VAPVDALVCSLMGWRWSFLTQWSARYVALGNCS